MVGGAFLCFSSTVFAEERSALNEDIRDIMMNKPPTSLLPFILVGVGIILLLISIWVVTKYLGATKPAPMGPPADYIALEKLNRISERIDSISPNKASLEISNTVKDFLSRRFRDPIRFETAEEYLNRISGSNANNPILSAGLIEQVQTFMNISQELKFAQLKEAKTQIPILIDQAEAIVKAAKMETQPHQKK